MSVFWSDIALGDATILIVFGIIIIVFWKLLKMFVESIPPIVAVIILRICAVFIMFGIIFLILIGIVELIDWIF